MRKGFVITVSTLLMLMVIIMFSQSSQRITKESNRAVIDTEMIDSASYMFDDVAEDLKGMLGPQVSISRNISESNITIIEQLPRSIDDNALLSSYGSFISNYSEKINSNISLNFSSITNGSLLIFRNGLEYDRNSSLLQFYYPNGDTNASAYEIGIFSNGYRTTENISSLQQSGATKLVIHYLDLNGSIEASGSFDPNVLGTYRINYENPLGSLVIKVGNLSGSVGGIRIEDDGLQAGINITARGGWNDSLGYAYNAGMNYTQLNVSKSDVIWVEEG